MMRVNRCTRWLSAVVLTVLLMSMLLAVPSPVKAAAPIVVNTWKDEPLAPYGQTTACSLREAIISANEGIAYGGCTAGVNGAADVISLPANIDDGGEIKDFRVSGSPGDNSGYTGDLDITEPLTISGAGMDQTTVSGNSLDRVFHIVDLGTGTVILNHFKITGGNSDKGGGILNEASNLVLNRIEVSGNIASGAGGGIRNKIYSSAGSLVGGALKITESVVQGNSAGNGGGISNDGSLEIQRSLIRNNLTTDTGGGMDTRPYAAFNYGTLVVNSTFAGNIAVKGAGIYTAGTLTLINNTLNDNRTSIEDEGLYLASGIAVTYQNNILSGYPDTSLPICKYLTTGQITSNDHNINEDQSCVAGEITLPPLLGLLGDYGGPTNVYSLQDTSPAIDAGSDADCPLTDQRSMAGIRPGDGDGDLTAHCDIGAFEKDPIPAIKQLMSIIMR